MSKKDNLTNLLIQALIWILLFSTPLISSSLNGVPWGDIIAGMKYYYPILFIFPLVFYANYFLFIPKLLFAKRSIWYFIANCIYVYGLNLLSGKYLSLVGVDIYLYDKGMLWSYALGITILNVLLILAAIGLRSQQRNAQLEMKEKENQRILAEQELHRLKSQLNPHFLFNTLNNISSLIAFNQDAAQDSMSRLSNMLRYVLYDSAGMSVALYKEVEFMRNYIDLMKLRYTDTLHMNIALPTENSNTEVAPLIYISLLENAFKYGASSQHPCAINIRLEETDQQLRFAIENTIVPRGEHSKASSGGVGIDNLKKRLQLIYPNKHSLDYGVKTSPEGEVFEVVLIIDK